MRLSLNQIGKLGNDTKLNQDAQRYFDEKEGNAEAFRQTINKFRRTIGLPAEYECAGKH
ncbi:hypothetical protein Q5O14_07770 [Eubacteriaceae bacterium ES2]|nr:hypothetical protein Q5O14_07770 [Eubacteriaceae bacterium ES2]